MYCVSLALQAHPDRGSAQEFQKISEAFSVLSDPKQREEYDAGGFNHKFGGFCSYSGLKPENGSLCWAQGCAYPPLSQIRDVSLKIAAAVAENMVKRGHALRKPADGENYIDFARQFVYTPKY